MLFLDKYVGIPYRNLGRTRSGVDCYGLLRLIYDRERGVTLPKLADHYGDAEDGVRVHATVLNQTRQLWEKVDEPEPWDAVVFWMGSHASHVGLVVGDNRFIHALKGRDACVERYTSRLWKNRIYGFYRFAYTP